MSEKKKFFFLHYSLPIGGSERALIDLLSSFDYTQTEVHLALLKISGDLLPFIPEDVIIEKIDIDNSFFTLRDESPHVSVHLLWKQKRYISLLVYVILYYLQKYDPQKRILFYRYFLRDVQSSSLMYDEAYSCYGVDELLAYFVAEKIRARKRIAWVHVDVSTWRFNKIFFNAIMREYHKIYLVSRQGMDIFDTVFPSLKNKAEVLRYTIPKNRILALSLSGPSFSDCFTGPRLLTVGRISPEKGQRIALEALKQLIAAGLYVRWYFVGDGPELEPCRLLASQLGLSDSVVFLGNRVNPYGYMKDCDIYVQPSLTEGFCIALGEALCFEKPIVATDFIGAEEQLCDKKDAIIVPCTPKGLARGISGLLTHAL